MIFIYVKTTICETIEYNNIPSEVQIQLINPQNNE